MAEILHEVGIQAPAARIYQALTTTEGLQRWWSQHSRIEPGPGGKARISFYNDAVVFELRNKASDPGKKVVWTVESGPPDWIDTEISWTLTESEGPTNVFLAHRGFASTEGNFASVNFNWGWYFISLKSYLEKGEGMPHTDADLPGAG